MKQTEMEALVKKLHVQPGAEMYDRTLTDTLEAQKIMKKSAASHVSEEQLAELHLRLLDE